MCDCEGPAVYREAARAARKAHRCYECRCSISQGERYTFCSGVWDGRGASYKLCASCAELRDFIMAKLADQFDCGPCFGDLLSWIRQTVVYAHREKTGEVRASWQILTDLVVDERSARIVGRAAGLLYAREMAEAEQHEERLAALRKRQKEAVCAS